MQQEQEVWTFSRFRPGQVFGEIDLPMDAGKRRHWESVFGECTGESLPRGMLVTAMMEAFIHAIQPRPQGNVHASQALHFTGRQARWHDRLGIRLSCLAKEQRKGRFWVSFGVETRVDGETVMTGTIRVIWAA